MTSFDAYELLSLWEAERDLGHPERALLLLGLARPGQPRERLAAMSIGERNRILFEMRQHLFGDRIEGLANCSQCDEALELNLRICDLLSTVSPDAPVMGGSLRVDEVEVTFRLPNTTDAILASRCPDPVQSRRLLLRRCVLADRQDGPSVPADELDDITLARIAQQMEILDPLSDVQLSLECAECGHSESILMDIASYLWRELTVEAKRLMDDVRVLAREYGWREVDILAMSGRRRLFYLHEGAS
jgi:hypothetical protein